MTYTVLNSSANAKDILSKAAAGTMLVVRKEKGNLNVYFEHNQECIGFIASTRKESDTKDGTQLLNTMESVGKDEVEAIVKEQRQTKFKVGMRDIETLCLIIEPLIEEKVEKVQASTNVNAANTFTLNVRGSIKANPAKPEVLKGFNNGQPSVILKIENSEIVVFYNDERAGVVSEKSTNYSQAFTAVQELKEVQAKAVMPKAASYQVEFAVSDGIMEFIRTGKRPMTLEELMEDKKAIVPMETMKEIQSYLKSNGVPEKIFKKIIESYVPYPASVQHRIKKPKTLFIDIDNEFIVLDAILATTKGINLLFQGEAGVGKNILTETMAWIYQRPLYEISLNGQTDKMDLLGSKSMDTEIKEGKEISKIIFEKEVFVEALEVGGICVFDEVNYALPEVLGMLNAPLDDRAHIEIPGYGFVQAHENFAAIMTMNKDYIGTQELNEAFKNRLMYIVFPNNKGIKKILENKVPNANPEHIRLADKMYQSVHKLFEDGEVSQDAMSIRGYIRAVDLAEYAPLDRMLKRNIVDAISNKDEQEAVLNIIDSMF